MNILYSAMAWIFSWIFNCYLSLEYWR